VTLALARSLLLADAVTPQALAQALLVSATRGTSLVRALLATRAMDAERLAQQLEQGDAPTMRHVAPVMTLVHHLPPGLCERLLALPVRRDPRTGTIDVAVVDARDPHPVEEIGHWLRAPVRMVRTSLASMEAALRRIHEKPEHGVRTLAAPIWVPAVAEPPQDMTRTPAYGSPAMLLDESELKDDLDDSSPTDVGDFPVEPEVPFSLTRRSLAPVSIVELGPPAIERDAHSEGEPVLDLRRRKPSVPPHPPSVPPQAPSGPPLAPNAPRHPFPDVLPILEAIRDSNDRDTILELLVAGARTAARKVAVLAVKREAVVGWTCSPELGDRSALRQARVSVNMSDMLAGALQSDVARLVRIPKDAAHAPLLSAMSAAPRGEVALAAVKVDGKAIALLLADEIGDTLVATRRMEELARVAGDALGRLLRVKRRA
jgi:Type II secretion system (T2SS), protein E, N-terminal domain